jgi:DNA-binding MarR family transcriptional regulator
MSSGLDTMFIELSKAVESNIFIAHQVVSPMLLGVKEEGQLGGRNELAVASELFYRQYVKPNQQRLDSIYTQFLNDMGIAADVETLRFEPVEIDYVALFEKGIVDKNEVRQKLGLSVVAEFAEEDDREMQIFKFFGDEETYFEFADLTEKELKLIEVVNENPKASLKEISEVTKIAEEDIDKILQVLDQKGKIKYTSKAVKILDADILKQTLVVRYKYDLRADAPKLVSGGESRDFCKKLISLGRVYSREDIDKMSTVLGYDVWKRRGGWYHNPNTDVNEPACRHEWKQIIVRRKNA